MAVLNQILPFALVFSVTFYNTSGKLYNIFNRYNGPPIDEMPEVDAQVPRLKLMQQYVDNFDPQNTAMWEMRYFENDQFYKPGGPIFIFLGGEWTINPFFLRTGQMYTMAKEHRGMMYYTEHRYYGCSIPTTDCSLESLKYLSADQALEDLARFIAARKEELFAKNNETDKCQNKVVVVGGSYAANLATWARLKYPHLIQAAWASSGPLRAVADFYEYLEVVGESIGLANKKCLNVIEEGIAQLEKLIETPSGQEIIKKAIHNSKIDFNDPQERSWFFLCIANFFMQIVQSCGTLKGIKEVCNQLLAEKGKSYEQLLALIYGPERTHNFSSYEEVIELKRDFRWNCSDGLAWEYQCCTEFGFFQTTNSTKQPFGKYITLDFWLEGFCYKFGKNFNEAALNKDTYRTNLVYGSTKPDVTRVVSVQGSLDPWHPLGVLEDLNEDAPAIFIQGTSHCMDIMPKTDGDLPQLINARNRARSLISKWLQ